MTNPMPSVFFGHGNPMNAVQQNAFTDGWRRMAASILKPRAILAISAHWYLPATAVTIARAPKTIHDFGGFPAELFRVQYPAPGDEWLARRVRSLLHPYKVDFDDDWGLDHGTWSVLRHAYPDADVPVVQLSINEAHPASFHFELGQQLAPLRSEGVLVVGSGNIVHNLEAYAWGRHVPNPYDWAERFERRCQTVNAIRRLHSRSSTTNISATMRSWPFRRRSIFCRSYMCSARNSPVRIIVPSLGL